MEVVLHVPCCVFQVTPKPADNLPICYVPEISEEKWRRKQINAMGQWSGDLVIAHKVCWRKYLFAKLGYQRQRRTHSLISTWLNTYSGKQMLWIKNKHRKSYLALSRLTVLVPYWLHTKLAVCSLPGLMQVASNQGCPVKRNMDEVFSLLKFLHQLWYHPYHLQSISHRNT